MCTTFQLHMSPIAEAFDVFFICLEVSQESFDSLWKRAILANTHRLKKQFLNSYSMRAGSASAACAMSKPCEPVSGMSAFIWRAVRTVAGQSRLFGCANRA